MRCVGSVSTQYYTILHTHTPRRSRWCPCGSGGRGINTVGLLFPHSGQLSHLPLTPTHRPSPRCPLLSLTYLVLSPPVTISPSPFLPLHLPTSHLARLRLFTTQSPATVVYSPTSTGVRVGDLGRLIVDRRSFDSNFHATLSVTLSSCYPVTLSPCHPVTCLSPGW